MSLRVALEGISSVGLKGRDYLRAKSGLVAGRYNGLRGDEARRVAERSLGVWSPQPNGYKVLREGDEGVGQER